VAIVALHFLFQKGYSVYNLSEITTIQNKKIMAGDVYDRAVAALEAPMPSKANGHFTTTLGDELAIARCDLDLTLSYKNSVFNFAKHREPHAYGMIVERKGAIIEV
jgi:hypothetical protein